MNHLFIGGVAHGRALYFPENLRIVKVREDMFNTVEPVCPSIPPKDRVGTQLYELRRYHFGPHIERQVFVLSRLSDDEALSKYHRLIFQP